MPCGLLHRAQGGRCRSPRRLPHRPLRPDHGSGVDRTLATTIGRRLAGPRSATSAVRTTRRQVRTETVDVAGRGSGLTGPMRRVASAVPRPLEVRSGNLRVPGRRGPTPVRPVGTASPGGRRVRNGPGCFPGPFRGQMRYDGHAVAEGAKHPAPRLVTWSTARRTGIRCPPGPAVSSMSGAGGVAPAGRRTDHLTYGRQEPDRGRSACTAASVRSGRRRPSSGRSP